MQSLGNDFVVIDGVRQALQLTPAIAATLADRRLGIGCDQILVAEAPIDPDVDFAFRIFNTDGSESAQCGNGARCFAWFLRRQGLTLADDIRVETHSTRMNLHLLNDGRVRVDMGAPIFEPARIPFDATDNDGTHRLEANGETRDFDVLSMGNPHAVTIVDDLTEVDVQGIGYAIERHPRFPERTNVGFLQFVDRGAIALRVFERGVGETQACGSGACAAVVSGRRRGLLDRDVVVALPGGRVEVSWKENGAPVSLTGDAVHVFNGEIEISENS
ncbi:MAG: diaminopimelate epimerase [Proteobacteria bacterium]|nr:MAG: diaminopimelate epimerase [Pseudomonadota bacterium]